MKAGLAYWICFSFYCLCWVIKFFANLYNTNNKTKNNYRGDNINDKK